MPSNDFLNQMMPAMAQYQNPNLVQGLVPGVVNTGITGSGPVPPELSPMGPPLPPAAPPVAAAPTAMPPQPVPIPEAPAPDNRPVVMTTPGTAGGERLTVGPTALALRNKAQGEREHGLGESERLQIQAQDERRQMAQKAYDRADAEQSGASAAIANNQKRVEAATKQVADSTKGTEEIAPMKDFWADKGVASKIGMMLAVGLTQAGQGLSRQSGPNPMMQALQSEMQRDLDTKKARFQQQTQLAGAKKDAAQQNFDNLVRQVGMDPALKIQAAASNNKLAAEAEMLAANTKKPEIMAQGAKVGAELRAQGAENQASALKLTQGSGPTQTVFDPKIGVAVPMKDYQKYRVDQAKEGAQQEGRIELAGMKGGPKSSEQMSQNTRFMAEKMQTAQIPQTLASIDAAASELKKGNTKGIGILGSAANKGGELSRKAYEAYYGKDASQREQDWMGVKGQIVSTLSGAGVGDKERAMWDRMLDGANTAEARSHALQRARERVKAAEKNIAAGAGPDASQEYYRNLRAQTPGGVGVNPTTGIREEAIK